MEKLTFKDSRAIKITTEMRSALNRHNQKQSEIDKANEELELLENSRKEKAGELESLNIKALDTDKKIAKEASKKIKAIDKEINKFQNDIQKVNDKINKLLEKNKTINMPEVTIKSIKDFGKTEEAPKEENINVDNQIIDNNIITPEIKIDAPEAEKEMSDNIEQGNDIIPNEPITMTPEEDKTTEIPIIEQTNDNNSLEPEAQEQPAPIPDRSNDIFGFKPEMPESETEPITEPIDIENQETPIEPVVLDNPETENNVEIVNDQPEKQPVSEDDEVVIEPFVSDESMNKIWNEMNKEEKPEEESKEEERVEEPEEPQIEEKTEESEEEEKVDETKIEPKNEELNQNAEIVKPDIFDDKSKFAKIADKVVSPSPLIPKESDTSLVTYNDYNDYVFKFGQKHYGKEALTPKEISDLSELNDFLDSDSFELERSKQYQSIKREKEEIKKRISKLDDDYKQQLGDMRKEHFTNLDTLGRLIDNANDIIDNNRTRISNLEDDNQNLNNTIDKQEKEIESLNKNKDELEQTIENLNNDIKELQEIKRQHEEKIENYESKFKEVLGIVREVKPEN